MEYYDTISDSYIELHGQEQYNKHILVRDTGIIGENDTVFDIGHGSGIICNVFPNNTIIGLDNSKSLLSMSTARTIRHDFNILPLPIEDNSYDHTTCITAVHHHNSPGLLAREMKRIARKTVIISILKKSAKHDLIIDSLEEELGKPHIMSDAYHDIMMVWLI
ncbi:MAG: class I SAM-dependent methyltransferase [Candidatus Woesearchaeota archaeon]